MTECHAARVDGAARADLTIVREQLLGALVEGDAGRAEDVALEALTGGARIDDIYVDVIGGALATVGELWERGEMSVADEHLATGIAWDVMRLLTSRAAIAPRRSREQLFLAAIGDEAHVTGLRIIGDLAEARGFDVRFLGASVPVGVLGRAVRRQAPEFVGLSVTMGGAAAELVAAVEAVLESGHTPRAVLVGGRAVPPRLRHDKRVVYAPDARATLEVIESLAEPV